jgi:cation transport ATPase
MSNSSQDLSSPDDTEDEYIEISPETNIELFKQFIEYQNKELAIKSEENQLNDKELDRNFQLAKMQMQEIASDRKDDRQSNQQTLTKVLGFSAVVVLTLAGFLGYAMNLGKDAIALEIIKAIIYLVAGAFGGYSTGLTRGKNSSYDDPDD